MGIEARELRIGNLIQSDGGETFKIEGIKTYDIESDEDMVRVHSIDSWLLLSDFRLIPLTEEWLFKFGSIKIGQDLFDVNNLIISKHRESYRMMDIDLKVDISYVHHLHNIFHSLTGEELKLSS